MTFDDIRPAINGSILTLYRIFAIITLYAVLAGVLGFALIVGFYAVSETWVAPAIVSHVDKETLDLTSKLLTTQSTIEALKLDVANLEKTVAEAQQHKAALDKIRPAIDAAIARENQHRRLTGPELVKLDEQKRADITRTRDMLQKLAEIESTIDKELAAGLITKTEAVQAKLQFAKSNGELTDSHIASTLLKDSILDKMTHTTSYLETLDKKVELESQIATLDISIETAQKQIASERKQVEEFDKAMTTAKQTPLWSAMQGGHVELALVPYDNQTAAVEGTPVYDCYFSFFACRQVGTLRTKFAGEQHAPHPIFRTELRGFLVSLELNEPEAAKSKTLFLGRKPLLF